MDPERSGLLHMLRVRVLSLLLILGVGLLLLATLVGSRILRSVITAAQEQVPRVSGLWVVLDPLILVVVSAQIVLLGAEFTQVYAGHRGERIVPDEHAVARDR